MNSSFGCKLLVNSYTPKLSLNIIKYGTPLAVKRHAVDHQFDGKYRYFQKPDYEIPKISLMDQTNVEKIKSVISDSDEYFAVVFFDRKQEKLMKDDIFYVDSIDVGLGEDIVLGKVLMIGSENLTLVGRPLLSVDLVQVRAKVIEHFKRKMVISYINKGPHSHKKTKCIFNYTSSKAWFNKTPHLGSTPSMTALKITDIALNLDYLYQN